MDKKIVRKQGSSNMISIPIEICRNLGIKTNTVLSVEQRGNEIILRPIIEQVTEQTIKAQGN